MCGRVTLDASPSVGLGTLSVSPSPGQASSFTVLRKTLKLQFGEVMKASAFTLRDTCE